MRSPYVKLIISVTLTVGLGALGGLLFNAGEIGGWYAGIEKPSFNPPNWLFAPVWTFLYTLMGISVYLVWKQPAGRDRDRALLLFIIQYALNFIWSFLFFKLHNIGLAFADIVALWVLLIFTIVQFSRVSLAAAWLLAPYIAWVSFAKILNGTIWWLNR
ncbi:TspO/MBR family protein [Sediminibacterium soli]|uniref:TspO/MBR family protein n=1 Tax=Sediminibacterium soli TaxID=2698829 RepID=UPI00137A40FD|nr:TspO/MBR family protein [Sediminibacterium soli]NCI47027.1 tryptophan-rich sensory protein [Sediminibacterium soli]